MHHHHHHHHHQQVYDPARRHPGQSSASSILYTAPDQSVVVVDIPRSIEEAQVLPGRPLRRHLLSSEPPSVPWTLPEPKGSNGAGSSGGSSSISPSAAIAELMTLETTKAALDHARSKYNGAWCLPRITQGPAVPCDDHKKRSTSSSVEHDSPLLPPFRRKAGDDSSVLCDDHNANPAKPPAHIPESSSHILGTIEATRAELLGRAPAFDLIVLDPPWPSRSVKRKRSNSYATVSSVSDAWDLLLSIPIASKLKEDGLVAVWVTNKPAIHDLLVGPGGGILSQWGLEPVGEWIWHKITSAGDPVFDVESRWRKPWERLVFARPKKSSQTAPPTASPRAIPTKVILAVPDLHSRKPNLRGLLQQADLLPEGYVGLEVFARNITAGWWSWGNEVLLFQAPEHWSLVEGVDDRHDDDVDENRKVKSENVVPAG